MDQPIRRPNAPTYAISTKTKDEFSKRLLEKKHTKQEILTAVKVAEQLQGTVDFSDPIELQQAWKNVHAITCDEAWGVGMGNIVNPYLNMATSAYLRALIEKTSEYVEPCSIANFMTRHIGQMLDPGFLRLLRVYLIAFPDTFEMPSTLEDMQFLYFDEVDEWTLHHPMIMASSSPLIPACVLQMLLEGGISANTRNVKGDTALMLSCKCGSDDDKVDLLLNYGANLEDFNCDLENAFHCAVVHRKISTLRKLLSARTKRIQDASDQEEDHWDDKSVSCESGDGWFDSECSSDASQSNVEQSQDEPEEDSEEAFVESCAMVYDELLEKRITSMENIGDGDVEYATRFRNKHLLYVDPIQMKNTCDESLIAFASKQCWLSGRTSNQEHMSILQLLIDAGASADGSVISKRVISHIRDDYHTDGYGIAKYWSRGGGEGTLVVTIQKIDYNVQVHFEIDDVLEFIDVKRSSFPFAERPTANDIEKIFECMKFGQQFDYNDCTMNGDDFVLNFYVSDYILDNNHHTYVRTGLKWCYSEKTERKYQEHSGRLVMRFPKGPVVMHHQFHIGFTTMNKRYTFLQHAMMQSCTQLRAHMFRAARVLCNPLITGKNGRTALQLLEEALKKNTKWTTEVGYSIASLERRDRGLLRHVRKDHDDMMTHVFRNALLDKPNSILYNEAEKKNANNYNLRKAKAKARFASVFHRLPDDVCAKILSFM